MSVNVFNDKSNPPSPREISEVLGNKNEVWKLIETHIENTYSLESEPKYYGKKSGWVIWFRKSGKTIVTMFPSLQEFSVMFVLGQKQFDAAMKSDLSPETKTIIESTKKYHDGRWFRMDNISDGNLHDIFTLLIIKTATDKKLELMFRKRINMKEVTVYRTWDEPMADMAIDLLKSEGINAVRIADVPRNVLPFTLDGLGEIEVRVFFEDSERALEILAVRFSEGEIESCEKETLEIEDSDLSDDEDNN